MVEVVVSIQALGGESLPDLTLYASRGFTPSELVGVFLTAGPPFAQPFSAIARSRLKPFLPKGEPHASLCDFIVDDRFVCRYAALRRRLRYDRAFQEHGSEG